MAMPEEVAGSQPSSVDRPDLSLIFIARNEEASIRECMESTIESARRAQVAGRIQRFESILVDSASTDRTVDLARKFADEIVGLKPTWFLSPAAGSYVGSIRARGRYIAIINADVIADRDWLTQVLGALEAGVDAVMGFVREEFDPVDSLNRLLIRQSSASLESDLEVSIAARCPRGFSAGTFVIAKQALNGAGGYHPFLLAAEDFDLRYRLLEAGFVVQNLPILQGTHRWALPGETLDLFSYLRTILRNSIGLGQVWRLRHPISRLREATLRAVLNARHMISVIRGAGLLLLPPVAVAVIATMPGPIGIVSLSVLLLDASYLSKLWLGGKKHGLLETDLLFSEIFLPATFAVVRIVGFMSGALRRPRRSEAYPLQRSA